jgi:predicted metalloendopeptidase
VQYSGFDWTDYLAALQANPEQVNVSQPGYVHALSTVLASHPLSAWREYLRWQVLKTYSPYLSARLAHEHFAFYGTVLEGTPKPRERWKRGILLVDRQIGEALGRRYVETYFPPESKARVEQLVRNLLATYSADIDTLDWMGADTKQSAHAKLDKILLKIGYPDHWRDYSKLHIQADDLVGNVRRSARFEYARMIAKLGHPVDRSEWGMTPPTINAYYNPTLNEIVFPAGILQPPFFNAAADDAVNYGGIGSVIGHEISHGFDDEGSQFDADGNLMNWWTAADRAAFNNKAQALVAEYGAFEPVKGFHINGALTLGENIGDNSGVAIAYKAYVHSLHGQAAPVLDGFTGEQRFYLGFAQVWRDKSRDEMTIELIKSDPHSMAQFRVLAGVAAALAALPVIYWLAETGYFGPLSVRVKALFVKHTKTGNPLVDSVAEHQAASPEAYWHHLHYTYFTIWPGLALRAARGFGGVNIAHLPARARLSLAAQPLLRRAEAGQPASHRRRRIRG